MTPHPTTSRFALPLLAAVALAALPCAAQVQGPAPELSRYDRLVGNWSGSGRVVMAPGGQPMAWQSVSTAKKILGGHFIQDDMRITFGAAMPGALVFRTITGWDASRERFVAYGMGNMGGLSESPAFWLGDDTLVTTTTELTPTGVALNRSVVRLTDKGYALRIDRCAGASSFYEHVTGTFVKGGEGFDGDRGAWAGMEPPAGEMAALKSQLGSWRMEGKMVGMPGTPPMKIGGREDIALRFGGHVHQSIIAGDPNPGLPVPYHGHVYLAWDQADGCYRSLHVDNFGGLAFERAWRLDGKDLVFTGTAVYMGVPHAQRSVVTPLPGGKGISMKIHRSAGKQEPYLYFDAVLTPLGGK